jgi:hypothetical protein
MEKEITTHEILDAVNKLSDNMEKKFEVIETQAKTSLETAANEILSAVNKFADDTEKRFDSLEKRMDKAESLMVTKDYLDDKLGDLKGDIIVTIRKEDVKVRKLIEILQKKNMLSGPEVKEILSMEPFPQLFV